MKNDNPDHLTENVPMQIHSLKLNTLDTSFIPVFNTIEV